MSETAQLPVVPLLPELSEQLVTQAVVLQAPPGAGKSTALPLYLLANLPAKGRIILVQPRRLAAVSIASFLAAQLGEAPGARVGYHVRQQKQYSRETRLVVVTEGILTRLLQSDPELSGIDLVIFDEFHERNLHSDLGLALFLEARQLRPELKLLVMSATLPAEALAEWLQRHDTPCQVMKSEGRQYPVEISYQPPRSANAWLQHVIVLTQQAMQRDSQGILVFLPGQAEIKKVRAGLSEVPGVSVCMLHGGLTLKDQNRAVEPVQPGERRVILTTNIAETSLTVSGIDLVIDCGRERQAQFVPRYKVTRLITRRTARAAATQRAGRAGRTGPGRCIRAWSENDWQGMAEYRPADIEQQDLTELLLEVSVWGSRPESLAWFTPPNEAHLDSARTLLTQTGALDLAGRATAYGHALSSVGGDFRSAVLLNKTKTEKPQLLALAALLVAFSEEQEGRQHSDLAQALWLVAGNRAAWPRTGRRWQYWCERLKTERRITAGMWSLLPYLVANMYPDRLARRRSCQSNSWLLSSGAGITLTDSVAGSVQWLIVAEVIFSETHSEGVIRQYLALTDSEVQELYGGISDTVTEVRWRSERGGLEKTLQRRVGALVLAEQPHPEPVTTDDHISAFLYESRRQGIGMFNWDNNSRQLLARLRLWFALIKEEPQRLSTAWLEENLQHWAAPYWSTLTSLAALKEWKPDQALQSLVDYSELQQLNQALPARWTAPSGRSHHIHYDQQSAVVALKLQEVFGTPTTPLLVQGRLPLTFDLLSPAGRLLQRTQDLAAFWQGAYPEVKKEMKGRYPKHPWPDEPVSALATHLTKRALGQ